MSESQFWVLIDQARRDGASSAPPPRMAEVLSQLSDVEIGDFCEVYYGKLCNLNQWQLWGAGFVIAGGMSDDSFHYFRSWIVGKGLRVFETAMKDPDNLGPFIDDPEIDNELLEYVGIKILAERGVNEDPRDRSERLADEDPTGEPFEEETVAESFPKLAALFGKPA